MWADNVTDKDFLGFDVHADLIKELLCDESLLPITIGLFGDWGSGKSSILETLKNKIDDPDNGTVCLYFNGWIFEGYDDAKAALLESIIKEFEDSKKFGEGLKENIGKLINSVDWMRAVGYGFKNIAVPVVSAYLTGGASLIPQLAQGLTSAAEKPEELLGKIKNGEAESFIKQFIKTPEKEKEISSIREFRNDFEELVENSKINKLVILVDDLDRCTPDRIVDNLEAIKLFLNVKNTAFVIGADPRIVRHAIEYRYNNQSFNSPDENKNDRIVNDYLEKLIQIPYNLPKLSDSEVETYITLLFCERDLDSNAFQKVINAFKLFKIKDRYSVFDYSNIQIVLDESELQQLSKSVSLISKLSPIITESLYGNPRQIKRFLNTFMLRKKLAKVANIDDFKDDILAKLMVLEYAELKLFEQLYKWQISQKGKPKELIEIENICEDKAKATSALNENYKLWNNYKVINWVKVAPKLSDFDLRDYFWLSRDKLSAIQSNTLVPPFIKSLLLKLEEELPGKLTKNIITEELIPLSSTEKELFFTLLSQQIISEPEKKRLYDIFNYSMDENINECIDIYINTISKIGRLVPPSIVESLKRFDNIPAINKILTKFNPSKKK
ncbi:P-loop NTPase fold protein [Labilibaculum sp. K2S]|uniref:KAP family P-loop NTPase fold protein n=1 Tax=Labilibaculum sp. K2S TaxID=3056386 RepID=UPI0025A48691|nr:P-loop NTPase fold protein [Labilibaculum sp. K2S]MDM8161343.1 P-loop NTPase fold protein [Labilibaculum sp. K2S]